MFKDSQYEMLGCQVEEPPPLESITIHYEPIFNLKNSLLNWIFRRTWQRNEIQIVNNSKKHTILASLDDENSLLSDRPIFSTWFGMGHSQSYPLGKASVPLFVTVVYYDDHDCDCEDNAMNKNRAATVMQYLCRNRAVEMGHRLRVEDLG